MRWWAVALLAPLLAAPAAEAAGTGEFVWMSPVTPRSAGWHAFDAAEIAVADGIAYASISKLLLPSHDRPWSRLEARTAADGGLLWGLDADERVAAGPVVASGYVHVLARASPDANLQGSMVDRLLRIDAATGSVVQRLDLPLGVGALGAHEGSVYAMTGRPPAGAFEEDRPLQVVNLDASTGQVRWRADLPGGVPSPPAFTSFGVVVNTVFGTSSLAYGDGSLQWSAPSAPRTAQGTPVADEVSVYVLSSLAQRSLTLSRLDSLTGTPVWSTSLPWNSWRPCDQVLEDGFLLVYGTDDLVGGSKSWMHATMFRAMDGQVRWDKTWPEARGHCSAAVSGDAAFFSFYQEQGDGQVADVGQAVGRDDGAVLWSSARPLVSTVYDRGLLIGFGLVRSYPDLRWDHREQGWLAVDAGAGLPRLANVEFTGPETPVRPGELLEFADSSTLGERPIVARRWTVESDGKSLLSRDGAELAFYLQTRVDTFDVTLTLLDDQFHETSATREFTVLPFEESQRRDASANGLWPVGLVIAVAFAVKRRTHA